MNRDVDRLVGRRWIDAGIVLVLADFMFYVRMIPARSLLGGDRPYFIGPDSYYHLRATLAAVRSFPHLPRWDPWTHYPVGTWTGQFGTAFDWVAAVLVLLVRGPGASQDEIARVLGVLPALLGALVVVPLYFLARRLVGRSGALVACVALALLPGEFLVRSLAGYADHHVAEVLTLTLATLGLVVAMERCHAEWAPARAWPPLRTTPWIALAGAALALEVYVWPPGILFLALLAAWACVALLLEEACGGEVRGLAWGAAGAFLVAGLLILPGVETWRLLAYFAQLNATNVTPLDALQAFAPMGAAVAIALVAGSARVFRRRQLPFWTLPPALAGLAGLVAGAAALADPALPSALARALSWVSGASGDPTLGVIAEALPTRLFCTTDEPTVRCLPGRVGLVATLSLGILLALVVAVVARRRRSDLLLLMLGSLVLRASTTQIRFSYYLGLTLPLLVGWVALQIAGEAPRPRLPRWTPPPAASRLRAAASSLALALLVAGSVVPFGSAKPVHLVAYRSPDPRLVSLSEAATWLRQATPDAGVDLDRALPSPPTGGYPYPAKAYGVLSLWSEGHAIEVLGHRPPVTNPFQQAAGLSAAYWVDPDPEHADALLDAWTGGHGPVRYVLVDDDTLSSFQLSVVWARTYDESIPTWESGAYAVSRRYSHPNGSVALDVPTYAQSMTSRLYEQDAAGLDHYRLVWEDSRSVVIGSASPWGCLHVALKASCEIEVSDAVADGYQPGTALAVGRNAFVYDLERRPASMIYERVTGAHLVGTAPPGTKLVVNLDVEVRHADGGSRAFPYQTSSVVDSAGRFDVVVPYATTAPVPVAQGGTRAEAWPTGPARVTLGDSLRLVDIPDEAVLHGDTLHVAP